MHLEIWKAIVLGLVEGITEYLPISSTGHLILAKSLMGLNASEEMRQATDDFTIIIQGGAILAVVGLYWPRCVQMLKGLIGRDAAGFRLFVNLVIAFIPSAAVGLLLDDWIERRLFGMGPVLWALVVGAIYMIVIEQWRNGRFGLQRFHDTDTTIDTVTPVQALWIGLLQCAALWPGTSRSMMTITGGVIVGLKPRQAAEFSFLLGLPTLLAATGYKLTKNILHARKENVPNVFESLGVVPSIVGIVVAAISAALAVRWLVGFLTRHGLTPFGWYRLALCAILLALISAGVVQSENREHLSGSTIVEPIRTLVPLDSSKKSTVQPH